jgi:hypothetical protein
LIGGDCNRFYAVWHDRCHLRADSIWGFNQFHLAKSAMILCKNIFNEMLKLMITNYKINSSIVVIAAIKMMP